ncbi:MAG TPA: glycoside hydrolase family 15 protein [Candidatus Thermoplasmatota archaeon]|nr:glycoside hydrolase family 15 protein [Candidatus Thermoplasmatota archaeon]
MITMLAGNSRILLTVDELGNWAQLYYPYAGQYQHLREVRLGIFDAETRRFSWLSEPGPTGWRIEQSLVAQSNAAETAYHGTELEVRVTDMVHSNHDLVIRRIRVRNHGPRVRKLRVFHYQSLTIQESMYQDTCYWDSERKTVNHYKRNFYFQLWGRPDFTGFTCGEHTLKGLRGSHVDAEDGKLEGGLISHGAADSVVQWDVEVQPDGEAIVYLLVMVGQSRHAVNAFYAMLSRRDPAGLSREAIDFWRHWLSNKSLRIPADLSRTAQDVYERTVFLLRDCASVNGAVVASPDPRTLKGSGDTYTYNWWRDGGYISKAMDEVGLYEYAHRFLQFAAKCQEDEGYFLHRHFPDGTVGSTWHPPPFIQADQTATVLAAAWHHFKRHGDLDQLLELWPMVKKGANWLESFVDERGLPKPSFDLWEERKTVNAYTCAAVSHGLERAARIGEQLGKETTRWHQVARRMREATLEHLWDDARGCFRKSIDPLDETIDASTLLAVKLGVLEPSDKRAERLVQAIEARLWNAEVGGLARYENDTYYGKENPWIICTLWLAEAHLLLGREKRCLELIEWAADTASQTFLLPEQLDGRTGEHTSVTPLTWSHSTFADVVNKYRRHREGVADDRTE